LGFALAGMLVGCGKVDRVERLTTTLQNGNAEEVRSAKDELVRIGQPAVQPMIRLLKNEKSSVRVCAAEVLAGIKDPRAVEPLIAALHDSPDVQEAAAAALGDIDDPRAVKPLIGLLGKGSHEAPEALARLGKHSLGPMVASMSQSPTPFPYDTGLSVLTKMGKLCVPSLIKLLRTTASPERKCKLLTALADTAGADAAESLIGALRDKSIEVRKTALTALKNVGDSRAVQPLARAMKDQTEEIRWSAAEALIEIGRRNPDAVKSLTDVLEKNDLRAVAKNYPFFIKLGRYGTEQTLIKALNRYGNSTMCLDYLNCGNDALDQAAREWAKRNGYTVFSTPGSHGGPKWGEGL